jgi:two-component system, NarL family, sensor histidine kinase DegS
MIFPLSTPGDNVILFVLDRACLLTLEENVDHNPIDTPALSVPTFFQLQEEERYRLAHALMDGPGQILANTLVELENCLPLIESDPGGATAGISSLREEIRSGLARLKTFVAELQPPLLAEMGLGPSLRQYVENFGSRNEIKVECLGCETMRERLPITMETAIFRIVQEALANILEHSGAAKVVVQIERVPNQVRLEVRDNGRGFAPQEVTSVNRRQLGLVGMYDRAMLIGGQLQIYSEARKGTRVVLIVPYHLHEEDLEASGGRNEIGRETQTGRKKIRPALAVENGSSKVS